MPKKPSARRDSDRKIERMLAKLRTKLENMREPPHERDRFNNQMNEAIEEFMSSLETLLKSNSAMRILVKAKCSSLRLRGYNKRKIRSIERMLSIHRKITDDWMGNEDLPSVLLSLLISSALRANELSDEGPIRR